MATQGGEEELSRPEYWNSRYNKDDQDARAYDWIRQFDTIKALLIKHLPPPRTDPKILHLGSGNSTLPADLLKLEYASQTAVDFSEVVVTAMQARYPLVDWRVMDIRDLAFRDAIFDVCIDKATLDAMLYGSLWDPPEDVRANVRAYVDEVARVLKPGGVWVYITWRQPHFIRPLLRRDSIWTLDVETLSDGAGMFEYFGFVMKKVVMRE